MEPLSVVPSDRWDKKQQGETEMQEVLSEHQGALSYYEGD